MCDHSEKGAIELLLSEENRSQLKDLGYEDAAKPILLNDFPESKDGCAQIRSQTWQVDASKAMEILTNASRTRTSNNAVLEVLASLIIHRDPLRPNLATGRFEVKENILVQRDLAQALTSISLCRTESRGQQSDALIAEAGLACLALLLYKSQPLTLTNLTLIHVIAYTDPSNCWTTRPAALLAEHILYLQISTKDIPSFTTGAILIDFIRPELPLSHSYATPASDQTELSLLTLDDTEDHEKTIVILKWAIEKAEEVYIARHWHHFTPALLRLAESRDTTVRLKALEAIIMFLKKCPSSTIYATGISYILENTILPTLLLLPPLTPERDSVALLDVGYQAIINLAAKSSDRRSYSRRQLLDTAIREGIMIGYHHAPGYTLIVKVLMQSTAKLVSCLGIFSVKHLTDLLHLVESVMCDPFIVEHPAVTTAASDVLTAIILNCWPRICGTKRLEQIFRILGICWLNSNSNERLSVHPGSQGDAGEVECSILRVCDLIRSISDGDDKEIQRKIRAIVERTSQLGVVLAD